MIKEGEIQTEMNQQCLGYCDKTASKIRLSLNPFQRLTSYILSCLKYGICREAKFGSSFQVEPEIQNVSELENEDFSNKVLIGIEVYMPTVDVQNNTLIPPKFNRPIFKYRDVDNDETPSRALNIYSKKSKHNRIKKRNKFSTVIDENRPLKTSDTSNQNSDIHLRKKINKFSTGVKREQLLKRSEISNKNSKFNTLKKKSNTVPVIVDKQPVRTSDMANENSNSPMKKKINKFSKGFKREQVLKPSEISNENSNFNTVKKKSNTVSVIVEKQPVRASDMANENSNSPMNNKINKFSTGFKREQLLKTSEISNKNSNYNTNQKKSNTVPVIVEKRPVRTSDSSNQNSDIPIREKINISTGVKREQLLKPSEISNENSNFNTVKKKSNTVPVIVEKQPVRTLDVANANSDLNITKETSKLGSIFKAAGKSVSKVSKIVLKAFKNKKPGRENPVIQPEIKNFSKMEQSNATISIKSSKNRPPTSINSHQSKSLALKSPSNQNNTKSKPKISNMKQKNNLVNLRNTKLRLRSHVDREPNVRSPMGIKPIAIKKCKISTSSIFDTSSQLSSLQSLKLCILSDTNNITKIPKYKSESFEAIRHEKRHKNEKPTKNEVDIINVSDRKGAAEIDNQELMRKLHHLKSSQIVEKVGKVRLPYSDAEMRSKLSESRHQFLEGNATRRHLPMQSNTYYYIDETPVSHSSRHLFMKQYSLQKRETSHSSRSTTTHIEGSRTTFRDGAKPSRKRTEPNPSATVAGRRRLLQLMKSDEWN